MRTFVPDRSYPTVRTKRSFTCQPREHSQVEGGKHYCPPTALFPSSFSPHSLSWGLFSPVINCIYHKMGICKCRKRTDLFCFVHKKAVCESCISTDHQVVCSFYHTFLKWTSALHSTLLHFSKSNVYQTSPFIYLTWWHILLKFLNSLNQIRLSFTHNCISLFHIHSNFTIPTIAAFLVCLARPHL